MKKAIIVLNGTPSEKSKFEQSAKKHCWLWNINAKSYLETVSEKLYWTGEGDFVDDLFVMANRKLGFEEKYLKERIERFLSDDAETKTDKNGNAYERFVLVIHGLSKKLLQTLESEYGVFEIFLSCNDPSTKTSEKHDYVLTTNDNLEDKVGHLIRVLTN